MSTSSMTYSKSLRGGLLLAMIALLSACVSAPLDQSQQQQKVPVVSPEVMSKYQSALRLMELGNNDAALKVFAGVSKMDDSLSGPYVNSGLIYLQQGNKELARKAFENAIQRNAQNATALNQLAILQREDFDFEQARKNYQQALAVEPANAAAHVNLAILCDIYMRDYACALQHYEEYLRIAGADEDVKNWVIDLKERM